MWVYSSHSSDLDKRTADSGGVRKQAEGLKVARFRLSAFPPIAARRLSGLRTAFGAVTWPDYTTMERGSDKAQSDNPHILAAFVIGAAAPFLISILSMLVSFNAGVSVATFFAPAILMAGRWSDSVIPIANGLFYGCWALAITLLLRLTKR